MAEELTFDVNMVYDDSEGTEISQLIEALKVSVTTKRVMRGKMNVAITEEAVPLGDITAPGYALFVNRDSTNFINLKVATGGAIFAKMLPGEFALLRLGSGAQAPFAIADSVACQMDIFLIGT